MVAAVSALRQLNAARIKIAAPVVAASAYHEIQRQADEVAAVMIPERFSAIGQWYKIFPKPAMRKFATFLRRLFAVTW